MTECHFWVKSFCNSACQDMNCHWYWGHWIRKVSGREDIRVTPWVSAQGDGGGPRGETVGVSGGQTEVNDTLPAVWHRHTAWCCLKSGKVICQLYPAKIKGRSRGYYVHTISVGCRVNYSYTETHLVTSAKRSWNHLKSLPEVTYTVMIKKATCKARFWSLAGRLH